MSRQDTPRSDDHRTLVAIREYVDLYRLGRKVALDVNRKTGEVVCMCTRPVGGAKGVGSVPMPYTDDWVRVMNSERRFDEVAALTRADQAVL